MGLGFSLEEHCYVWVWGFSSVIVVCWVLLNCVLCLLLLVALAFGIIEFRLARLWVDFDGSASLWLACC